MPARIKVLVIDGSALIRRVMSEIISRAPDMALVGTAPDLEIGRNKIRQFNPDVLTLDTEVPTLKGLDFMERLMRLRPMPVLMLSSQAAMQSRFALRALELGAINIALKPQLSPADGSLLNGDEVLSAIRHAHAAGEHLSSRANNRVRAAGPDVQAGSGRPALSEKLIVIGASTGGPQALRSFLAAMPPDSPAILITQHMPAGFTTAFARSLNKLTRLVVAEAAGAERICPGHVYLAPGSAHLRVTRHNDHYVTAIDEGEPVNLHRPSVDVLFESAAAHVAQNAIGVLLTGMGKDGARGLLAMRKAGARTYAQDQASSIVFGMPREAVALGAAQFVAPLEALPRLVSQYLSIEDLRAVRG